MISLEQVIKAISSTLEKDKILILHKGMEQAAIKIYKKYFYRVYLLSNPSEPVFTQVFTERVLSSSVSEVQDKCDIVFLKKLMEWIQSDNFKRLKDGI